MCRRAPTRRPGLGESPACEPISGSSRRVTARRQDITGDPPPHHPKGATQRAPGACSRRSAPSASACSGPPSASSDPATITTSSMSGAGRSSSHRSSHRAASRRDRGRSRRATSAVSSSASPRSSRPASRASSSALTRLPCSIARRNAALGWPWEVVCALLSWGRNGASLAVRAVAGRPRRSCPFAEIALYCEQGKPWKTGWGCGGLSAYAEFSLP